MSSYSLDKMLLVVICVCTHVLKINMQCVCHSSSLRQVSRFYRRLIAMM